MRAKDIVRSLTVHLLVSAAEPLMNCWHRRRSSGSEPVVQRVADYRSADDGAFVLHQREWMASDHLNCSDDDGRSEMRRGLKIECRSSTPRGLDQVSADPDRPRPFDTVTVTGWREGSLSRQKARAADSNRHQYRSKAS